MPEITLAAEIGRTTGSSAARRLRAEGKIPGTVYGHGTDPVSVAVVARELRLALNSDAGVNALLSLETSEGSLLTLARELQHHPVKGTVTHVDFQIVRRDEMISAEVPIVLIGDAVEVGHGDGTVDQQAFSITIHALPSNIPTGIEVDISALTIGASIRIRDLVLPEGVTTELDPEAAVVIGQPPRTESVPAEGEDVAEGSAEPTVVGAPEE